MEAVGSLASKVVENILVAKAKLAAGDGALAEVVRPTRLDRLVAVNAAVKLELAAANALANLMLDPEFWRLLQKENARRIGKARSQDRSKVFIEAMRQTPTATWKEIIRKLEQRGDVTDDGEYYRVGDTRIRKSSLPSKLSRLRKRLRS